MSGRESSFVFKEPGACKLKVLAALNLSNCNVSFNSPQICVIFFTEKKTKTELRGAPRTVSSIAVICYLRIIRISLTCTIFVFGKERTSYCCSLDESLKQRREIV